MSKKIKIYRVVDRFGYGYKRSLDSEILNWTEEGISKLMFGDEYFDYRPMPQDDGISPSRIRKYHLFGFISPEDLQRWFFAADQALGNILGGRIHVYEVAKSHLILGGRQLIFDKRKARLIDTLPMNYFLSDEQKASEFDFKKSYTEGLEMTVRVPDRLEAYFTSQ